MDKRLDWDYFDGLIFAIDQPSQFWNHHIITHILSHLIKCRCNKPNLSNFYPYKDKCIYGIQDNKIVSAPIDDDITPQYRVGKDCGSRGPSISPVDVWWPNEPDDAHDVRYVDGKRRWQNGLRKDVRYVNDDGWQ